MITQSISKIFAHITALLLALLLLVGSTPIPAQAGDELGEVLGALFGTTGSSSSANPYRFRPGDLIVERTDFAVYYAGWEPMGTHRILLLQMRLPNGTSYEVHYPDPGVITVRDLTLEILNFSNTELRMRQLRRPL